MYENQTYEVILRRMMDRIPDSIDKRPGSIIFDAMAPAGIEMAQLYSQLDVNQELYFVDTAGGEYLTRRASERGIIRHPATPAIRKAEFRDRSGLLLPVAPGERFSGGGLNFFVLDQTADGAYRLQVEEAGNKGNQYFGDLLPIGYIDGLATARLGEVLIPGSDQETDDALRQRYLDDAKQPATSGNKAHYVHWARSVAGVGGVKVTPLWEGPGTVMVLIVGADMAPANKELVEKVQNYIDPEKGKGEGQAPIGAHVTVASAKGKIIDFSAKVILAPGYGLQMVTDNFLNQLEEWRQKASFSATYVSLPVIGSLLLATEGILDYSELTLNESSSANIALADDEVPIIGIVDLEV
ncbi:baseplate J/gp47 family protein [Paenibacillus daejeonensis]|uniref:baseplate J/gp47 family protein n=1 Tax=Paenibacillus daejeonensis TaxID=135193 RepID=UPI00035E73DD|nr:baseplate J/gp47 family protein [Paenibacillus daejeonensis]